MRERFRNLDARSKRTVSWAAAAALLVALGLALGRPGQKPAFADDPSALTAFQGTVTVGLNAGQGGGNGNVSIPAGRRLIVERVTARGTVPNGQIWLFGMNTRLPADGPATHALPLGQGVPTGTTARLTLNVEQRGIYADSPNLTFQVNRFVNVGGGQVIFTVSGHLTPP